MALSHCDNSFAKTARLVRSSLLPGGPPKYKRAQAGALVFNVRAQATADACGLPTDGSDMRKMRCTTVPNCLLSEPVL